jgi:transposase
MTTQSQTPQSQTPQSTPPTLAAFIGIDWADQKHAVCLRAADSAPVEHFTLEQKPEVLADWIAGLRTRFGGRPVGICLEQKRGGLIHALLGHDFLVLYPVHPTSAKRYRQLFAPSGAKDDPVDADLLCDLLRHHRDRLRPWQPDTVEARQLALLCEHRRDLVHERTKLIEKLTAALKAYFPQALEWAGRDLATPMACDFLQRWPTREAVQQAKPDTLRRFYYGHRCRRGDAIEARLAAMRTARALTTDAAIVGAHALLVQSLASQLRSLLPTIARYDEAIATLFAKHPDAFLWESFPGAGAALAPRLAAAFGTDRERFAAAVNMAQMSGIAPVTERSGGTKQVHRRYACPRFWLQTFHEYARCSIRFCRWAQAYYEQQREKGHGHHAAIRSLAWKWIRVMWRCWRDRVAYDDGRYEAALRRQSPLGKRLPSVAAAV